MREGRKNQEEICKQGISGISGVKPGEMTFQGVITRQTERREASDYNLRSLRIDSLPSTCRLCCPLLEALFFC